MGWSIASGKGANLLRRLSAQRRRDRWLIPLIAAACLLPAPVASEAADVAPVGTMAFVASVSMTQYPCVNGCDGALTGSATVVLSGTDSVGSPFSATWTQAGMTAQLIHTEICDLYAAVPPPQDITDGQFTISGGHFTVGGTGDPATLTSAFTWVRAGTAAELTVHGLAISGSRGAVRVPSFGGWGAASIVPTGPVPLPTCQTASGSLTELVAAADVQIL